MKIQHSLIILGVAGLLSLPASAQPLKVGTIDLRKVFDNYYKTKQADAKLKEEAADLDKERKLMVDQFQKAQDNYKKVLDSANEPAVSSEERDKRKKAAEDELVKLKELQNNVEQFDRQARTTLGEKQRRMRDNLLAEIKEVIKAKAKAGNFTYVLDTAAESINNTPFVLYTTADNDLSDDILKQLNLSAPAEAPKAAGDAKPPAEEKK